MPNGTHSEVTSRMLELNHRLSSTNVERPQVRADLRISQSSGAASHCISVSGGPLAEKKTLVTVKGKDFNIF